MKKLSTKKQHSRRDFVKNTALGIGAATVGLPLIAKSNQVIKKRKLGVALVGLGYYATEELGPALLSTENCYLAGIVTGTMEKEKVWSEKYSIPEKNIYNYNNFDEIVKNDEIDIVCIVLPNSMHAEYTIRAAQAKKHVFCEKPMAISVKECEQMIAACKNNNVKLTIGYRLHYDPYHKKIIQVREEEKYGLVKYMDGNFGFRIGNKPNQWRLNKSLAGGGSIMDLGIYSIQAARYSSGKEPTTVFAREFKSDAQKFKEVDDTVIFQMTFSGGAIANCTSSYSHMANKLFVSFEKGLIDLHGAYGYSGIGGLIQDQNWRVPDIKLDYPKINQQATHFDDFARSVKENTEPFITGEEGLKDLKVIEAIKASMQQGGKPINI